MIKELLKRPIGVTMSVVAIVVLSIVAMGYLPVSLMPAIDIPQITIQVSAPGLSVREVDNTLLKPLKNQLSQVTGLKNITAEIVVMGERRKNEIIFNQTGKRNPSGGNHFGDWCLWQLAALDCGDAGRLCGTA